MPQDMESDFPDRRTSDLRILRFGFNGTHYFVTCCTAGRAKRLNRPAVWSAVLSEWKSLDDSGDAVLVSGVLMPDHIHWVFRLGERLALDRVVARFKSRTRAALEIAGCRWQPNFFEHRLRDDELMEPFVFYMFLNPWRARLVSCDEPWPYWVCHDTVRFGFLDTLRAGGLPYPAWVGEVRNPMRRNAESDASGGTDDPSSGQTKS